MTEQNQTQNQFKSTYNENELGYYYENDELIVFFGKADTTFEMLKKKYSHFQFLSLKQTHSDLVLGADHFISSQIHQNFSYQSNQKKPVKLLNEELTYKELIFNESLAFEPDQTYDAVFTSHTKVALVIKTADCLPILIKDHDSQKILAIHAGWRGVENLITLKSLNASQIKNFDLFIGPHIQPQSFLVKEDVYKYFKDRLNCPLQKDDNHQYRINLLEVLLNDLNRSLHVKGYKLSHLSFDTFNDDQFNSYRFNQTTKRNLSFIVLK